VTRGKALLLGAAMAAALASGCDLVSMNWSSDVSFTIDRDRAAAGQSIEVTFEKLADEDGKKFWIALQREDAPSTETEGKIPIAKGARSMRLTASAPGPYEVRVYSETNGAPNMIVARRKLRVME
jgi:hypothetical protein